MMIINTLATTRVQRFCRDHKYTMGKQEKQDSTVPYTTSRTPFRLACTSISKPTDNSSLVSLDLRVGNGLESPSLLPRKVVHSFRENTSETAFAHLLTPVKAHFLFIQATTGKLPKIETFHKFSFFLPFFQRSQLVNFFF